MITAISSRGTRIAAQSPQFFDILQDLWDPVTNPNGFVNMGLAENSLMHDEMIKFLNHKSWADSHALTYGDGFSGSDKLKASLCHFLNHHFSPCQLIEPSHIVATAGVSNAIECCAWALCDPRDFVLIGRPYWTTFKSMLGVRAGVNVEEVGFGSTDPFSEDALVHYKDAYTQAEKEGKTIRAILLCNPHNPLGRCYSKEVIQGFMSFCQEKQIHLIFDEIYALSVWGNPQMASEVGFISALAIDTTGLIDSNLLHVLWGMSKDFGATGLRIGCVISQANKGFLDACISISLFSFPSSLADKAIANLLADRQFTDDYLCLYRERLKDRYDHVTSILHQNRIPYEESNATLFIWANLGAMVKNSRITDDAILKRLRREKLYITSGVGYRSEQTGWFRIVFAHSKELLDEGLQRMIRGLSDL
ncbi:putative aspartate aminotransferase [Aaosphaeria arxii CBS 175.79]|uniref:Putative aspartate aminotransferase n=1 Tax=Aaosphaeria arxii CBS 175.79 TaxID=1450172 RepID=A0A6A5Y773_9PLEO|nr:putative aspartate aminotransferase [Aaosphaeria arxii CBS 175.79]KAF2020877.1 putative aspartate aminotransferase [Aaosphaeria arxii CBS 175.79]